MKAASVFLMSFAFAFLFYCSVAVSSAFEYPATPIEQDDEQLVASATSEVFGATPAEQDDVKTIDQVNDERSTEFDADPIEQDDVKTIDQLNQ
jgi:hypothetical protein